jgi:two-component system sensor histidine kinase KdpD
VRAKLEIAGHCLLCALATAGLILIGYRFLAINAATAALLMLLLVLGAAAHWGLAEAFFTSIVCVFGLNFYFLPPIGTFTISDPENWVALLVFLVTSVTASQLSAQAKRRAEEAVAGRIETGRLYEISRALLMDEASDTIRLSVAKTGQILGIDHIAFLDLATGDIYGSLEASGLTQEDMMRVAELGEACGNDHASVTPVRLGTRIVGSLALHGGPLDSTVRESVASLLAINYERVRALDRAAASEIARRNEEFKSSLLDGLAHDLKTPLTAIRTCVTHLITAPPRSEAVRDELLSIIDQESERLQGTITEAIQLARIESRELHLRREPVSAAELIRTAIEDLRDDNLARYAVTVTPPDLLLDADPGLLRRALMQVVENARKYTTPDSPIQVDAGTADEQTTLAVSDRGPGIAPDELERVFEKFYRGRRTAKTAEGTGMGLAIAKGIIEAHGGKIRASNRTGGGATITVILPAHE